MANSVHQDRFGPDWPLGNIVVTAPGTQVSIMSLVDSGNVNSPSTATGPGASASDEYTVNAQAIIIQPGKGGGATKLSANTGNIYLVRRPTAGGGGTADVGVVIAMIKPTDPPYTLQASAVVKNIFNLYRYFLDADTANDAANVTAIIE